MYPITKVSVEAAITSDGNPMATFQLAPQIKPPQSDHQGLPNVNNRDICNQLMMQTDRNEFIFDPQDRPLVIYFRLHRKDSSKALSIPQDI